MPLSVEKKFLRLIMLLQKSAHPVCKAYFETIVLARAEYKGDLKTFLSQHKHDIYHLVHKIKCCQCSSSTATNTCNNNKHKLCGKQLKKIYADTGPTQGHVQSAGRGIIQHCICGFSIVEGFCIDNMDLSTVNAIIQACVQGLDSSHIMWLNKILEKRNELCHIDDLDSQTESYMDNSWDYIKKSVLGLAKNIPPEQIYMKSIESGIGMLELAEFQQNDVTPILNSMKEEIALISETIRSEMKVTMMDASKEIKEISGNANKIIDTIKEKDQKIDMMREKLDTIYKAVEKIGAFQHQNQEAVLNVEWSEDAIISDDEKDVAVCFHFDIKPPCSEQVKAKIIQEIRKLKEIVALISPYKIVWTGLGSIVIASLLKKNLYANKDDFESSVRKFLDTFLSVSGINCHSPCTIEVKIRISEGMPEYFENSEETESLLAKYFNKEQQVVPEMINSSLGNRETLLDQLVFLNLIINKENLSSEVGGDKKGGNKKILLIADRSDLCILQQITQLIESTLMTRITEVDIGTVLLARTNRDVDVAYAFIANSYSRRTTINAILELIQCPKRIDLVASDGLMYVMSPTEFIVINENESWKEIFMSSILAHYTASVTQENQSLSSPDKKTFIKDLVKHQIEEDKRGKNEGKIASSDKRTKKEQTQLQEIETGSDWVDPDDPTVIAENELLGAANSIEAAARKLAMLKPRQKARVMVTNVTSLLKTVKTVEDEASRGTQALEGTIEAINQEVKTDQTINISETESYVDFQTNMVSVAKRIAMTAQEMVGKSTSNPADLGSLANQLTRDYDLLASNSAGAAGASASPDVSNRIRTTVMDLGKSCIELVQDAGNLQGNPNDTYAQRDLADHARSVNEKVSFVLASLQAGSRGTQACINAASTVSGIIADLDTTIMFATAGTLNRENEESFTDHRENIFEKAKALVEDTKTLVAGAASYQEELAGAAQQAVKTITQLADVVKFGASSLGSDQPEAQVLLINAVKDVASALADLISATKNASGKSVQDPAMLHLKESAKVMVTNVTSLLKTVKIVEDEASRGTQALEGTIEAINQEVKAYDRTPSTDKKASAEDLIRLTKLITTATAKAVHAGNSCKQEDILIAANVGRKAVFDLLGVCKAAAATAETTETRVRTVKAGRATAVAYIKLLNEVHSNVQKPSQETRQNLITLSRQVATSVQEIVHAAEVIKGSDWVDPDDPTVIAENELLGAANSIEAAARKLAMLKPRQKAREADMSLNFEEQILEAAKSIAFATAALVKSASAAQKELVEQGKIGAAYHKADFLNDDGQWSQGLISAARMVAGATHSLCESANAMVQDNATEEKLIASAKEVAGSTAALLVACKVKADPGSMAMQRLQSDGYAVKKATDALVRAAQQAKENFEEQEEVPLDPTPVGGIRQELQAQEEILKREKELEKARIKLAEIRKARYKPDDYDSSSSNF